MAIPNSNYNELASTTISRYSPMITDNVTKNNAFMFRIKDRGNIQLVDGGNSLLENLSYAENSTFKWYSGYEVLDVEASDVISSAEFAWKQGNVNVTISGLEMRNNAESKQRMHNLLKSRIDVAQATANNQIGASLFSDGTTYPKAIGGLQLLVADDPTSGTVGGIDRSANAFWRNQIYDFSVESVTPSATTMVASMNKLFRRCTRGVDVPDLVIADNVYYGYYEDALTDLKRFSMSDTKLADAGFTSLKFNNADVIYDVNCPASHLYMLNTKYIGLKVHRDANFRLDKERIAVNQDAYVYPLLFQGNMTMSNASLQGVMHA